MLTLGYGFLSENTVFVAELEKNGVVFIGPNSRAIKGMGDKLASKKLAKEAKVNGIPGYDGVIQNEDHCVTLSNEVRALYNNFTLKTDIKIWKIDIFQ